MPSMATGPASNPLDSTTAAATTKDTGASTVRMLLPYLWPPGDRVAQVRVVAAVLCLILAKVATVCIPILYSRAVDHLAPKAAHRIGTDATAAAVITVPVALIIGYCLLRIASGGFAEMRDAVFSAVQQRAVRRIALQTFEHLHRLSLRFHLDRHTGGLSRAIDRGTNGIEQVLRFAVFNIIPTLFELTMVTVILWRLFDWRYAATTLGAVGAYIAFTLTFTNYRVRFRRLMNDSDADAQTKAVDSLLNYETVKYFGNERHEAARFDTALAKYERAAVRSQVSLNLLNIGQSVIIALGLAAIMLLSAKGVASGHMTVGRFVLANTYLMQLYTPLTFLGFVYREVKQGLVDTEQMFRLMQVGAEVSDRPGAQDLVPDEGAAGLEFTDVRFGYGPQREILKGVSFVIPPGGNLAVVGPTGAGKSTLTRLLFRFYDVGGGSIRIGGEDIRGITQDSLRAVIGVVPQDTVLFNDTIRYNIAYGRPSASPAEVENAARLAQLHDFIQTLPQGYETKVGERGLKLSGGEKQRVAIARTLLKNPRILVLDEATSALDTNTEQEIQAALRAVARNRTTLTIAHRLSTVVDADEILVLNDGQVVERGSHWNLLARGGIYAGMWAAQAEQDEGARAEQAVATKPRGVPAA
ncbi:MAG: ABC transporter ATP-binding protein/permease [Proteobacteria bacterium]|nr:ABC transporter ATP-binding protein/permease [Pseudomonadota bacterium]